MTSLQKAYADFEKAYRNRFKNYYGYKQAKAHYEKELNKRALLKKKSDIGSQALLCVLEEEEKND